MSKDLIMRLSLFVARLINAYSILIWIRIIMSWVNRYPQRNSFTWYMGKMVDPYLTVFRKKGATIGALDFSPILAIGILFIFESVFSIFGTYGQMTVAIILSIFLSAFWHYGLSIYFLVLFITLVMKLISSLSADPSRRAMGSMMGNATAPVTDFVRSMAGNRLLQEKTVNIISLVLVGVVWFISSYIFQYLSSLVLKLGF